jgi:uncharacterized RmlC-like cupin family protein
MPSKSLKITVKDKSTNLLVKGQGVILFNRTSTTNAKFTFFSSGRGNKLSVEFSESGVQVSTNNGPLPDSTNTKGLIADLSAPYWFSLDSQNQILLAGIGEARMETVIYAYSFPPALHESNKEFLESLSHVVYDSDNRHLPNGFTPLKIMRDPVTASVPLTLKDTATLTMDDVASGTCMPVANLPATSQKLYNCIAGPNFCLETPEFPDFYKAIELSIATPGCWCYETLKKKATEFSKDRPNILETYLRITLGQNNGESPGVPYVMEIWPAAHYSPVHSHAGAEAVIRVLQGEIHVDLYPYLSKEAAPFLGTDFVKGDVMWISPTLNQTHQLKNTSVTTCVTIQCYMYDETDDKHYDYFDYLDENGAVKQYEPDSDMDFVTFKDLMLDEWATRPRGCCPRRH